MNRIRLYPSGHEVECKPGETVLSALEQAGYALPNNCRAGACGECKVKVRSGEFDQGMVLDMALAPEEREQGYGLMCMAKPTAEILEIEWGTDDAQPKLFPPKEDVSFIVVERFVRTPRILELRLRPLRKPVRYWPGQYMIISDIDNEISPRAYSIANAPRIDGEIILQVTRVEQGTTSHWIHDQLQPGDRVKLSGPYGTFIGDPSAETPVLCLAAGSGLAPIMALAEAALGRGYRQRVTLLFSAPHATDLYEQGRLALWKVRHRNFKFIPTLTREEGADNKGRITSLLPEMFPDLSDYSVFVAGSPEFVDDCVSVVRKLGAKEKLLHTEGFHRQRSPELPSPDRMVD
ncbi:MAG: 2Fe-2S iron-sulfur cluster binding domain-containing protein [Gammaproteobacteria bacterium]|nr:2Fe-2S iron-sulfur cluster binding domain-containing protein [Gammaproteobacteria bacterium]